MAVSIETFADQLYDEKNVISSLRQLWPLERLLKDVSAVLDELNSKLTAALNDKYSHFSSLPSVLKEISESGQVAVKSSNEIKSAVAVHPPPLPPNCKERKGRLRVPPRRSLRRHRALPRRKK
jgi:hypothetical protein